MNSDLPKKYWKKNAGKIWRKSEHVQLENKNELIVGIFSNHAWICYKKNLNF